MAFARQSRALPRSRPRGRLTEWGPGPTFVDSTSASTASILSTTVAVVAEKVTIVRVRGSFHFFLTAGTAIGDGFRFGLGIGVIETAAIAAGVGSLPTPITEVGWRGWLYHEFFDLRVLSTTLGDGVNAGVAHYRAVIDSKAMRIQGSDQSLFAVYETVESGAAVVEVQGETRILDKLG